MPSTWASVMQLVRSQADASNPVSPLVGKQQNTSCQELVGQPAGKEMVLYSSMEII